MQSGGGSFGQILPLKRRVFLAVTALAVALLAGCSSSPSKISASTSSTTPTTAQTKTTTAPPSNPPPTTSSTTLAAPSANQCTASELRPSWPGAGDGATGHVYFVVNLLNSSSATCVTGGYVGVAAYDPAGELIAASESRDLMGSNSPPTLSVAPGASMHFYRRLRRCGREADGGTECSTTVGALHLIPPNETAEVQIATPVSTSVTPHFAAIPSLSVRSLERRSHQLSSPTLRRARGPSGLFGAPQPRRRLIQLGEARRGASRYRGLNGTQRHPLGPVEHRHQRSAGQPRFLRQARRGFRRAVTRMGRPPHLLPAGRRCLAPPRHRPRQHHVHTAVEPGLGRGHRRRPRLPRSRAATPSTSWWPSWSRTASPCSRRPTTPSGAPVTPWSAIPTATGLAS